MTSAHFSLSPPRFCPNCGGHLSERLLETEERPRLVCDQCQRILYLKDGRITGDEKIKKPKRALRELKKVADLDADELSEAIGKHTQRKPPQRQRGRREGRERA